MPMLSTPCGNVPMRLIIKKCWDIRAFKRLAQCKARH